MASGNELILFLFFCILLISAGFYEGSERNVQLQYSKHHCIILGEHVIKDLVYYEIFKILPEMRGQNIGN